VYERVAFWSERSKARRESAGRDHRQVPDKGGG
jgi:hypothetical protein